MLLRLAYLGIRTRSGCCGHCRTLTRDRDTDILALRHQLAVLHRQLGGQRIRFEPADRAWLAALLSTLPRPSLHRLRLLVRPDTVLRWHRDLHAPVATRRHRGPAGEDGPAPSARSAPWCCQGNNETPHGAHGLINELAGSEAEPQSKRYRRGTSGDAT